MKIAAGFDHAGYPARADVFAAIRESGGEAVDMGTASGESCDYPDYALKVARAVASGECDFGVIVCGTGIGVSITANKVRGIRAAVAVTEFMARAAREHNDANVLCMGERTTDHEEMRRIVGAFLSTAFAGGRHARRVGKMMDVEDAGC